MDVHSEFVAILKAYKRVLPGWFQLYERTGHMHFDPYIHDWKFSKIESNVWGDIRGVGIPLYPQFPAERFFLDFANPFLKIGIECDGKEFHDRKRDEIRDKLLAEAGWMIFRMPGHECVRQYDLNLIEDFETRRARELMHNFHHDTSEGVLYALKWAYFGGNKPWPCSDDVLHSALSRHRTTPERAVSRVRKLANTPTKMSDDIEEHIAKLERGCDDK